MKIASNAAATNETDEREEVEDAALKDWQFVSAQLVTAERKGMSRTAARLPFGTIILSRSGMPVHHLLT